MQRKLELELDKQSVVYKKHKNSIQEQISTVNDQLKVCLQLKDQCVDTRLEKHEVIVQMIEKTKNFKLQEAQDAKEILAQREQLLQLETEMRRLHE